MLLRRWLLATKDICHRLLGSGSSNQQNITFLAAYVASKDVTIAERWHVAIVSNAPLMLRFRIPRQLSYVPVVYMCMCYHLRLPLQYGSISCMVSWISLVIAALLMACPQHRLPNACISAPSLIRPQKHCFSTLLRNSPLCPSRFRRNNAPLLVSRLQIDNWPFWLSMMIDSLNLAYSLGSANSMGYRRWVIF